MSETLLISAGFALASAVVFGLVGRSVTDRDVSSGAQRALTLFGLWWYALAIATAIGAVQSLLGYLQATSLAVFSALVYLNLLLICVALLGLLYYLLYLFTGKEGLLKPLVAGYVVYYTWLVYLVTAAGPTSVTVGNWSTSIEYAQPLSGPVTNLALLLLVAPQIIGALAYFTTFFRLENPEQRYRVAVVSWSIILWFGSSLLASLSGLSEFAWWQVTTRIIGLTAALAILTAYRPPRWIERHWQTHAANAQEAG